MGLDVSTYVVYGKLVPRSVVRPVIRSRGCNHQSDVSQNFCSVCGKPVWIETETSILEGMNTPRLTYFYPYYEADEVVIGFALSKSGSHRNANPGFLEVTQPEPQMTQDIMDFFQTHSIPLVAEELKIYALSYFSY